MSKINMADGILNESVVVRKVTVKRRIYQALRTGGYSATIINDVLQALGPAVEKLCDTYDTMETLEIFQDIGKFLDS